MKALFLVPPSPHAPNVVRDLVYGCWCKGRRIAGINFPPLPLALAATVLKQAGHQALVLDLQVERKPFEQVVKIAETAQLAVVLTSSVSFEEDAEYLSRLKYRCPKLLTAVYGGFPSAKPEAVLQPGGIDIVIRGEGEMLLRELARKLATGDWQTLPGLSFKSGSEFIHNPDYPQLEDLDCLPVADRELLPPSSAYFNPVVENFPYATMTTSRGCSGQCTFCASPSFYGSVYRAQSPERVVKEMQYLSLKGYREIFFRDENFTGDPQRVIEICRGIRDLNLGLSWVCSARVDQVSREALQMMKGCGCHLLRLGVESGSQELLDEVKKGIRVEQTRKVFGWCREFKLDTHAHLMVGLPGESRETLEQTGKLIRELNPSLVTIGILTPYPGTPLFENLSQQSPQIAKAQLPTLKKLHTERYYPLTSLSGEELAAFIRKTYRAFYFRPGFLLKNLLRPGNWRKFPQLLKAAVNLHEFTWGMD